MNLYKLLIVGAGGFLGSIVRYITVKTVDEKLNVFFPFGTLTVNLLGCFLIGVLSSFALRKAGFSEQWSLFLATGFCGGFTTFSAFALENINVLNQKLISLSLLYVAGSIVLGFLAVIAGMALGKIV